MDMRAIFMGLAFALMWSSAFTSARIIVEFAPPLTALALRFAVSGVIGVALAALLGQSARLSPQQWRTVLIFGICQNALYLGMNFVAMQWIEASVAAIIASLMPMLVALAGWFVYSERPAPLAVAGLAVGLAGVVLIMSGRLSGGADMMGIALCIGGVVALTVATLAVRGAATSRDNLLMVVGLQMLVGSAVLGVVALIFEPFVVTWTWQLGAAFAYTTLVPGLLATYVWFLLVGRIGAVKAATFHFLNPFFGVAIAAVLLGESFGWRELVGIGIITLGILAVQISRARQTPTR
ncbi:MAG: DMT family transporter [Rhodobacteraceae bacterium]|nr:DMT family transporter [Paracoccaceae bacterium]